MKHIEGNYTKIPNEVLEGLMKVKLNSTQYKIILTIIRYTYGFQREEHKQSVSFITQATDSDTQAVRRGLKHLIESNLITVVKEATFKSSRILKINENINTWGLELYQNDELIGEVSNDSTSEGQNDSTPGGQNDSQETKTKQNIKQKGKSEKSSSANTKKEEVEEYFNTIWEAYPRKKGKSKVSAKQKKKLYQEIPVEQMLQAIEKYKRETKDRPEEYIMHGSSFFNNGYEDYIQELDEKPKEVKPVTIGSYDDKVKELEEAEMKKYGIR